LGVIEQFDSVHQGRTNCHLLERGARGNAIRLFYMGRHKILAYGVGGNSKVTLLSRCGDYHSPLGTTLSSVS